MLRSGFRRPGRSVEVLSSKLPSRIREDDKNDARHSTNRNDMKRAKEVSPGTQTDCKYTSMNDHT
jgi:hypothetical protein